MRQNTVMLLAWIKLNVPCFTGPVPQEWTDAVMDKMVKAGVPDNIIADVFRLARGHVGKPTDPLSWMFQPKPKHPTIGLPRTGKMDPVNLQIIAERLERNYIKAQFDGDTVGMAAALVELAKIIAEMVLGHGEGLQIRSNEALREWEELKRDVDEALGYTNALNLRRHIRNLSYEEYWRLKGAPTPDAVRYVKTYVLPRSAPPPPRIRRR